MIFLAILLFPILEIALAVNVIDRFGFVNAFFAWLFSFILGLGLFRMSSFRLTIGVAKAMREGRPPELAAIDGAMIGLAGVLFLLPGYFSDFLAIFLLVPPIRRLVSKKLLRAVQIRTASGATWGTGRPSAGPTSGANDASSAIIDVDAVVIDDGQIEPRK